MLAVIDHHREVVLDVSLKTNPNIVIDIVVLATNSIDIRGHGIVARRNTNGLGS